MDQPKYHEGLGKAAPHMRNTAKNALSQWKELNFLIDPGLELVWTSSIIALDYFSIFFKISQMPRNVNATQASHSLKRIFSRHEIPQFNSQEFTAFANDWQFEHITSSPWYPQSNGEVERAVQTMKMILNKEKWWRVFSPPGLQRYSIAP